MSLLSVSAAQQTGNENLNTVRRMTLQTANGRIECPVIVRRIQLQGISSDLEVAVHPTDDIQLLGVDFFRGKNYSVDYESNTLFIGNAPHERKILSSGKARAIVRSH